MCFSLGARLPFGFQVEFWCCADWLASWLAAVGILRENPLRVDTHWPICMCVRISSTFSPTGLANSYLLYIFRDKQQESLIRNCWRECFFFSQTWKEGIGCSAADTLGTATICPWVWNTFWLVRPQIVLKFDRGVGAGADRFVDPPHRGKMYHGTWRKHVFCCKLKMNQSKATTRPVSLKHFVIQQRIDRDLKKKQKKRKQITERKHSSFVRYWQLT